MSYTLEVFYCIPFFIFTQKAFIVIFSLPTNKRNKFLIVDRGGNLRLLITNIENRFKYRKISVITPGSFLSLVIHISQSNFEQYLISSNKIILKIFFVFHLRAIESVRTVKGNGKSTFFFKGGGAYFLFRKR